VQAIIEPPPEPGAPPGPLWKRLSWFFGLTLSAMLATAIVGYGLRALLR